MLTIQRDPVDLLERQVTVLEESVLAQQSQQARLEEALEYLKLSNLDLARSLEKHAVALREGLKAAGRSSGSVRVVDFEMSFVSIYILIFKWLMAAAVAAITLAAIPALLLGLYLLIFGGLPAFAGI